MTRYFVPIKGHELIGKIAEAAINYSKGDDYEFNAYLSEDAIKNCPPNLTPLLKVVNSPYTLQELTPRIKKDLSKVDFECENLSYGEDTYWPSQKLRDTVVGLHKLENNLVFLGCYGGGDWEVPLIFIIYWDGKELRGYVPKEGNPWNTSTRAAYGNDEELDNENALKRFKVYDYDMIPDINPELIFQDINSHFKLKVLK